MSCTTVWPTGVASASLPVTLFRERHLGVALRTLPAGYVDRPHDRSFFCQAALATRFGVDLPMTVSPIAAMIGLAPLAPAPKSGGYSESGPAALPAS